MLLPRGLARGTQKLDCYIAKPLLLPRGLARGTQRLDCSTVRLLHFSIVKELLLPWGLARGTQRLDGSIVTLPKIFYDEQPQHQTTTTLFHLKQLQ